MRRLAASGRSGVARGRPCGARPQGTIVSARIEPGRVSRVRSAHPFKTERWLETWASPPLGPYSKRRKPPVGRSEEQMAGPTSDRLSLSTQLILLKRVGLKLGRGERTGAGAERTSGWNRVPARAAGIYSSLLRDNRLPNGNEVPGRGCAQGGLSAASAGMGWSRRPVSPASR
jgi:hypothetical protein